MWMSGKPDIRERGEEHPWPLAIWYYLYVILEDRMKIAALVGIVALVAFNLTASAAEPAATAKAKVTHHAKHRQTKVHDPYAALEPYRSMDFKGAYPGDYALRRSLRECVEDLGYGRWASCEGPW
jgi:hypothetical protein